MAKEDSIFVYGKVVDVLPNAHFRIILDNGLEIMASISGRMRKNRIFVIAGDRVKIEMTHYDLKNGRVVERIGVV